MVAPARTLDRIVARLVPGEHVVSESDLARRSRLVVFFALVVGAAAGLYGFVFLALGMTIAAFGSLVASSLSAVAALSLRRGVAAPTAGHVVSAGGFFGLVFVIAGSGGAHAAAAAWLVLPIVVGTMVVGRRAGVQWFAASAGYMLLLALLDGPTMASLDQVPPWFASTYGFLVRTGLLVCLLAIAVTFELAREHAAELARKATLQLEAARHDAERAHGEVRQILDTVNQGLVIVQLDGRLTGARSAQLDAWFPDLGSDRFVWDLFRADPRFADWLELAWGELASGWLPRDVVLAQLPREVALDGEHFELGYWPQPAGDSILLVVTSTTAEVRARAAREEQEELHTLLLKVTDDPDSVRELVLDSRRQVDLVAQTDDDVAARRALHTLKGNCSLFGMQRFARWLHGLEDEVRERGGVDAVVRDKLQERWRSEEARLAPLVPDPDGDWVRVPMDDLVAVQDLARHRAPEVAEVLDRWTWDDVPTRLSRLAARTRDMARRLGRERVEVRVEADAIRVPPTPAWQEFWSVAVHLIRNALDHGIEPADERVAAGKAPIGQVTLRAVDEGDRLALVFCDDGRGIDWAAIADRARQAGLPSDTMGDLQRALFADGVTSRATVSEVSGRGVGTSAVWSACEALDGSVSVESTSGLGTCFRFDFVTASDGG